MGLLFTTNNIRTLFIVRAELKYGFKGSEFSWSPLGESKGFLIQHRNEKKESQFFKVEEKLELGDTKGDTMLTFNPPIKGMVKFNFGRIERDIDGLQFHFDKWLEEMR